MVREGPPEGVTPPLSLKDKEPYRQGARGECSKSEGIVSTEAPQRQSLAHEWPVVIVKCIRESSSFPPEHFSGVTTDSLVVCLVGHSP